MGKGEIAHYSNISFSHSVFKRLVCLGRQKVSLCGNGLSVLGINLFQHYRLNYCQLVITRRYDLTLYPKTELLEELNTFVDNKVNVTQNSLPKEGWKTLWDKEKILVDSIFSFFHNVFKGLFLNGCQNFRWFWKEYSIFLEYSRNMA